jgi:hypothetical protein
MSLDEEAFYTGYAEDELLYAPTVGSDGSSDYEDILDDDGDTGQSRGTDFELARMQSEHAMSMVTMRHQQELTDIHEAARQREKGLRHEVRRRDKALRALAHERAEASTRLTGLETERSHLAAQVAALQKANARQTQHLAALRAQVAADKTAVEARAAVQQERLEEANERAYKGERAASELRREVEAANLARQEAERAAAEARDALQGAWRDLGSATAAKELMAERVALLRAQLHKLDEGAHLAVSSAQQRETELREACAALAATREQRNQAAREAEACRVTAAEASEDLHRSSELMASSEARVAAAERKAVHESMGRQRAEKKLADEAAAQRAARSGRQRRMLGLLLAATRGQCAIGFARWLAAAAAIDAAGARKLARAEAAGGREREAETRGALEALEARDGFIKRVAALGGSWLGACERWLTMRGAAAILSRWAAYVRAQERCERRWANLVKAAELDVSLLKRRGIGHPGVAGFERAWPRRLLLHQRAERLRAFYKRGYARCRRGSYYDSGRVRRAVFVLWRLWVRGELLTEHCDAIEARDAGLHVAGRQPWWELERGGGPAGASS